MDCECRISFLAAARASNGVPRSTKGIPFTIVRRALGLGLALLVSGSAQTPVQKYIQATGTVTIAIPDFNNSVPPGGGEWDIKVNGFEAWVYGPQSASFSAIAQALASVINSGCSSYSCYSDGGPNPYLTASAQGNVIYLTSRAGGSASNYPFSAEFDYSYPNPDPPYNDIPMTVSIPTSGPTLTGGKDISGVQGYVNPRYLIMGVTYAPPGGSGSSVSYQTTNAVGNTSTITKSFTNGAAVSISVSAGSSFFGVIKGNTTVTSSRGWTQKTTNANAVTITKTSSTTMKTPGVPNVYSPVNHDYDIIWLWLNPVTVFTHFDDGSLIWNGYGFDLNDPLQDVDVWPVYAGYLNGDFGPLDAQDAGALARSWATTQSFGPGQGPGITSADFSNILKADPFAYNPYDASPGYVLTLAAGTNPATSTDGRFTAATPGNGTPQSIPYAQAPPNSTQGLQSTYQSTYQTINQVTQASDYTYSTGFGLDQSFSGSLFGTALSADLRVNWTFAWGNISQTQNTSTNTQTDTAVITSPPCPATTAPCNPQYTEPHEFAIYQDNLYGTFMFWPNPYFSISGVVPTSNTFTAGAMGSYKISTLANAGYSGGSVQISVSGLPAGANYTPGTVVPGNALTLNISTDATTPPGSYPLTFRSSDGSLSYFAYATLVVIAPAPTPSLTSLSPISATAGGPAFPLTANGSGFLAGSNILWNGSPLSTSYVSGTQLSALVSASLIASQGSVTVTVQNPGGVISNPLSFTINAPGSLTILTASPLPNGMVGVPYSQGFTATGGISPYKSWAVAAGSLLPPGLSLTQGILSGTGLLSGTPTFSGSFTFSLQVTDNSNTVAIKQFSLMVGGGLVTLTGNGIVNAASYAGGRVSPGEIVTIFGSFPGPAVLVSLQLNNQDFVSTDLGGEEVFFDGVPAPMIYAMAGQVACVVPYEVSGESSTQIQVSYQGQLSNPIMVPVASVIPGIFTVNASGSGQGAIVNQDGTVNSRSNPAAIGSIVSAYGTGEGQTNPAGIDGRVNPFPPPQPVLQPVTATVGNLPANVTYAGGTSGLVAGVLQVNIQLPQGVSGDSVPIAITIGGVTSQGNVTLAIH